MLKLSMWRDKLSSYKVQNFLLSCRLCIQIITSCSSFGSKQYTVFSLMRFYLDYVIIVFTLQRKLYNHVNWNSSLMARYTKLVIVKFLFHYKISTVSYHMSRKIFRNLTNSFTKSCCKKSQEFIFNN